MKDKLAIGGLYSKRELAASLREPNLGLVREGVYNLRSSSQTLFFVDLEKSGKEERFHFDDYFEEDWFHWDSQTTQHLNSPKIQEIINGEREVHLFARVVQKIKGQTQPFVYCGRLEYDQYDPNKTSKPIHIRFLSIDYQDDTDNAHLQAVYQWKPEKAGKTPSHTIPKHKSPSEKRKQSYRKPTKTERSGLVTSRVGQGYYRQQVRQKWSDTCPITGLSIPGMLISSHIKRWSESSDEERLDPENGILLSPNADALFDKHLISFSDEGRLLCSSSIDAQVLSRMGIDGDSRIRVSPGMRKYLQHHRTRMLAR